MKTWCTIDKEVGLVVVVFLCNIFVHLLLSNTVVVVGVVHGGRNCYIV